jgi:hypothetical protein
MQGHYQGSHKLSLSKEKLSEGPIPTLAKLPGLPESGCLAVMPNSRETGFSVTSSVYQAIIGQFTENATLQAVRAVGATSYIPDLH